MILPGTELRLVDDQTGHGVFATERIPRGTVVWIHDDLDQVFSTEQVEAMPELMRRAIERYAYVNAAGLRVLCWDHGRYMNHSCAPTTTSVGTFCEIARRDILPGEQLTCEYGLAHVIEGFACTCGAPNCRGGLMPTDMPEVWQRWDREAADVLAWALEVPQPILGAARRDLPGMWIVDAIRERRAISLPSWSLGVPGGS